MTLFVQIILPDPALTLFNIYSSADGFINAIAVNVPVADLLVGIAIADAPEDTTFVKVQSIGEGCTDFVFANVNPPA